MAYIALLHFLSLVCFNTLFPGRKEAISGAGSGGSSVGSVEGSGQPGSVGEVWCRPTQSFVSFVSTKYKACTQMLTMTCLYDHRPSSPKRPYEPPPLFNIVVKHKGWGSDIIVQAMEDYSRDGLMLMFLICSSVYIVLRTI